MHSISTLNTDNILGIAMTDYAAERISDLIPEIEPLLQDHFREISVYQDTELDIDWDRYARLERTGGYSFLTCRRDGRLLGWAGFFVYTHIRYRNYLVANEDMYYLRPEHRRGRTGIDLLKNAERQLQQRGVRRILMSTKVHEDHSRILEYLGYEHHQKNFNKILDTVNEI
jgi:L-amino acid N-acyltransferase YncA